MITGAAGNLGSALAGRLHNEFEVIACDRPQSAGDDDIKMDITDPESIDAALRQVVTEYGNRIAAVVHLAAYFDFTGEDSPLYKKINEDGTRDLLKALNRHLEVERFIYASTMLVHEPVEPGQRLTEATPLSPKWAYPQSKLKTEKIIEEHHGQIPVTILRLAGVYNSDSCVPTLAHQIARIHQRALQGHLYAGDQDAGQAFIHTDDMLDAFVRAIQRRSQLSPYEVYLAGESDVMSYGELQDSLGALIHGEEGWATITVPAPIAKAGAWVQEKAEPLIPDQIDHGEEPFIKPFMVEMASDHYALDTSRIEKDLRWLATRSLRTELPRLIDRFRQDPKAWYSSHGIPAPSWLESAVEKRRNPEKLRAQYENAYSNVHSQTLWAPCFNLVLAVWLILSPASFGYQGQPLALSDMLSGGLLLIFAMLSLSSKPGWRMARWGAATVGLWLTFAPLVFWTTSAAGYLNSTLVGFTVMLLALAVRPFPALSPTADLTGPDVPPGWDYSPSDWMQRVPIIALAFLGFFLSRYMAAYQLGHIDAVWDPFFATGANAGDGKNGTEEIITSSLSEAWPVPDAGLGAAVYLLEVITGMIGSRRRWRTMPWLVLLFGFLIVPLGAVSITFIIIQPILLGTWCTLCLIGAGAMLLQIPYSFDEILATLQFLRRRAKAGKPWLIILFTGDTDDNYRCEYKADNFARSPGRVFRDMLGGGVEFRWPLVLSVMVGGWLMTTRLTIGSEGSMANADHLIGALVITVAIAAFAEVARPLRFLNILLGAALFVTPLIYSPGVDAFISSYLAGAALILLSLAGGQVTHHYGEWDRATNPRRFAKFARTVGNATARG